MANKLQTPKPTIYLSNAFQNPFYKINDIKFK